MNPTMNTMVNAKDKKRSCVSVNLVICGEVFDDVEARRSEWLKRTGEEISYNRAVRYILQGVFEKKK
jgi:hypothetical protein